MIIELPDDRDIRSQAIAAGFSAVEDYVRALLDRDAERVAIQNGIDDMHAGRLQSFEEVDAEIRSRFPVKLARADIGADHRHEGGAQPEHDRIHQVFQTHRRADARQDGARNDHAGAQPPPRPAKEGRPQIGRAPRGEREPNSG